MLFLSASEIKDALLAHLEEVDTQSHLPEWTFYRDDPALSFESSRYHEDSTELNHRDGEARWFTTCETYYITVCYVSHEDGLQVTVEHNEYCKETLYSDAKHPWL